MIKPKLIMFDLDDTLYRIPKAFDEAVVSNIHRFYRNYFNLKTDADVLNKLGELKREYGSNPRAFYAMEKYDIFSQEIFGSVNPSIYLKRDGNLIRTLKNINVKKSILTNGPDFFSKKIMDILDIYKLIDHIEYGNSVEPKPSKFGFEKILKKFSVEPADCIMVGNSLDEDIIPAKELGMTTVLVNGSDVKIRSGFVDFKLHEIYELNGVLNGKKK